MENRLKTKNYPRRDFTERKPPDRPTGEPTRRQMGAKMKLAETKVIKGRR